MNLTLLRIILGVLGLVPIVIGATGMFSGLERLYPVAKSPQTRTVNTRYLSAIYLGFGVLILGSSPGWRAKCRCSGSCWRWSSWPGLRVPYPS